jgi:hypothetical protein
MYQMRAAMRVVTSTFVHNGRTKPAKLNRIKGGERFVIGWMSTTE